MVQCRVEISLTFLEKLACNIMRDFDFPILRVVRFSGYLVPKFSIRLASYAHRPNHSNALTS